MQGYRNNANVSGQRGYQYLERHYPRFCPASLVKLDVHLSLYLLKSTKHFIKIFLRWHFIIALEGISEFQIPEVTGTLSSDCIYQARFKI